MTIRRNWFVLLRIYGTLWTYHDLPILAPGSLVSIGIPDILESHH